HTTLYTYDVNNRRIAKSVDGVVERYVLDRDNIALVFDGSGHETHRYLYGPRVDMVLADEVSDPTAPAGATNKVNWLLGDNQGTIRDVVSATGEPAAPPAGTPIAPGTVIDHLRYNTFGVITAET